MPHKKAMMFAKGLNQSLQGLMLTHVPMGAIYESLVEMVLMSDIVKEGESKEEVKLEGSKKKWWEKNKKKKKGDGPQKQIKKLVKCHSCGNVGHTMQEG